MKVVLLGPPGVGKGTYGKLLERDWHIYMLSTGERLRYHVKNMTDLGIRAQEDMESGGLVSDDVMIDIALRSIVNKINWILDGFPRTIPQAEALQEKSPPEVVLNLTQPYEVLEQKIINRSVCSTPECEQTYNSRTIHTVIDGHEIYLPPVVPKIPGICDKCGEALLFKERTDDQNPEVIRKRFEVYEEKTRPLIDFYNQLELLEEQLVTKPPEDMIGIVKEILLSKASLD